MLCSRPVDTATSADQWEVLGSKLATQFSNNIRNNFGFLNRSEDRDPGDRDLTFRQEGRKVFKEVVPMAAAHIEAQLAALGADPAGPNLFGTLTTAQLSTLGTRAIAALTVDHRAVRPVLSACPCWVRWQTCGTPSEGGVSRSLTRARVSQAGNRAGERPPIVRQRDDMREQEAARPV